MTIDVKTLIPPLCRVKRKLPMGQPVDIDAALEGEWQRLKLAEAVQGKQIAIGVGSRGVAGIQQIAAKVVSLVKASGGQPFIVPAMGSHGGATPAGQLEVLSGLGVTEETMGCPIKATMETTILGQTQNGLDGHIDRNVAEADGLILINRVKIHTDFHGPNESGLVKMLAIGLGKETGAKQIHSFGVYGLRHYIPEVAEHLLSQINFVAGFATIEDGYHQAVQLEGFTADTLMAGEQRLLEDSRRLMPRLPVDDIDVLVIDWMGKDISGAGMDTNIIGRWRIEGEPEPPAPRIKAIVVLDLTPASHGNATAIGLADFTTRRMLDKTDFNAFTTNIFTSGFLQRGKYPLVFETDEAAIEAAVTDVFRGKPEDAQNVRVVRIQSTLHLETTWVSQNILDEIRANDDVLEVDEPRLLEFSNGHLHLITPE